MNPTIQLRSGLYFNFAQPDPDTVDIGDVAHALSHVCRYAGHCAWHYSVAQHSLLVAYLCPKKYRLWGLLHDATEAYLMDVPTPLKRMLPDYKALEQKVEEVVLGKFGLSGPMPAEVKEADLMALAVEHRDLFSGKGTSPQEWAILDGIVPPSDVRVTKWEPQRAANEFLNMYLRLTAEAA